MNRPDIAELAAAFDLTDSDIEVAAEKIAGQVQRMAPLWKKQATPEAVAVQYLTRKAKQHHVSLPDNAGFTQLMNRLGDPAWWRRALRKRLRVVEHHAILRGAVHRHASPYVSEKALRRFETDRRRLAALMASLEVVKVGSGEVMPLDEVIAGSQANPANRRAAMMVRIKGIEARARAKSHTALFLTITAPSRMHVRHFTGQRNDKHDGGDPRQVQAYLNGVWRRAMRALQHSGLTAYGLRVVEPHHDGCPHWHVVLFAAPEQSEAILSALRAHALADSPDEPGAAERRFTVVKIDPAKGGAVAYVAKYVSKRIDGEGLGTDTESDTTGTDTARRVVAWARRWGIRQFQFFGLPPITPMRELYRHNGEGLGSAGLSEAHQACKANDHAAYLGACEAHGIDFAVRYDERPSTRYADELARAIRGLCASAADLSQPLELVTRTETWRIQPKPKRAGDGAFALLGLDSITARRPVRATHDAAAGATKNNAEMTRNGSTRRPSSPTPPPGPPLAAAWLRTSNQNTEAATC